MNQLLKFLCEGEGFGATDCSFKLWNCYLLLVLHCCINPEAKNICLVLHQAATFCPCLRCLSTVTDIRHHWCPGSRNVDKTKAERIYTKLKAKEAKPEWKKNRGKPQRRMEHGKQILRSFLLFISKFFLYLFSLVPSNKSFQSLFLFESSHNPHLGNSKLVKECGISCLSSNCS